MTNSIIRKKLLHNKTIEEVTEILGDDGQYIIRGDSADRIVYLLGTQYGIMTANNYYMNLYLRNDTVARIEVGSDNGTVAYELRGE